jgi:hypothetical protein
VALVHRLEEGHLGVPGEVHVLSAVSDELHKTTSHLVYAKILFFGKVALWGFTFWSGPYSTSS